MKAALTAGAMWFAFAFIVLLGIAWQPLGPVAFAAGDRCFRCGRAIVDTQIAAQMLEGQLPTKYRTSGCLARYLANHPNEQGRWFVADYTTGRFIDAGGAWFVPVVLATNEHHYRAFRSRRDAEALAASLGTGLVRWDAVVARASRS
jgi:hypothetical protein